MNWFDSWALTVTILIPSVTAVVVFAGVLWIST